MDSLQASLRAALASKPPAAQIVGPLSRARYEDRHEPSASSLQEIPYGRAGTNGPTYFSATIGWKREGRGWWLMPVAAKCTTYPGDRLFCIFVTSLRFVRTC